MSAGDIQPLTLLEPTSPQHEPQQSETAYIITTLNIPEDLNTFVPNVGEATLPEEHISLSNGQTEHIETMPATQIEGPSIEAVNSSIDTGQPEDETAGQAAIPESSMDMASTDSAANEDSITHVPDSTATDQLPNQANSSIDNNDITGTEDLPPTTTAEGAATAATEEVTTDMGDEVPAWVQYDEDTSVPDEEEMKELEDSEYDKLSAHDINAMEEQFYTDLEDPEYRPVKKLRLTWVIRGVRGTRETPNFARVMNSPGACVDGLYWSLKFYPRGDNCSSLSAFVRCSREPPPVDDECPESDFAFYEGLPDADFSGNIQPKVKMTVPAKARVKPTPESEEDEIPTPEQCTKQADAVEDSQISDSPVLTSQKSHETSTEKSEVRELPNWRVSAQVGMAIYNPAEPRTGHLQSDGHQFSKICDDWGWVNFVPNWDSIHKRKRGQRQALLRNDTLAIDAYVRIHEDPTEALWWHESKDENQWPSKELAGYFSMGTPGLYHSPAVAGITAWMLLAPFREILQSADGGGWRTDSKCNPKPLVCHSQLILDQMRNLSSDCYVNLYKIIEEFLEADERWNDVKSFWEVFRRGLELELGDDHPAMQKLSSIFDANGRRWEMPRLPVPGQASVKEGLAHHFDTVNFCGPLPDFMPVMLNRSDFDEKLREWKLHNNRIRLDDEFDLSKWCNDGDPNFTLYGFMVHVGARNSGKFYSVLRPGGINTKWLAFEDGNGNKVFSYSKRRIQEYEGLEGDELRKFPLSQTRENAYLAMYIRTSKLSTYLPGGLEPYRVPKWLKPWADDPKEDEDESHIHQEIPIISPSEVAKQDEDGIAVEIYLDECVKGCVDMLKLHDLRNSSITRNLYRTIRVSSDRTFKELRSAVARALEIEDISRIQMWELHYQGLGKHSKASLDVIPYRRKLIKETIPGLVYRIWLSIRNDGDTNDSYSHLLDQLCNLELHEKKLEKDANVGTPDLKVAESSVVTSVVEEESTQVTEAVPVAAEADVADPDVEQASVASAVNLDIGYPTDHQARSDTDVDATGTPASTEHSESSESEDDVLTPISSARSVSLEPESSSHSNEVDNVPETSAIEESDDELVRPVVHGHLIDAAQHASPIEDIVITHTSAMVPHGDVAALAQVLAEEVTSNDDTVSTENTHAEVVPQTDRESQNKTPTPPYVPRTYGNIHFFDVDAQCFVAQTPIHPELGMELGTVVRQAMGYDSQRQFKIWKYIGNTGAEVLQLNLTFLSANIHDFFTIIVGDALSDTKIDELKAAGKFWQPQQLIRYLNMIRRQHPYATLTSTESVELADFGNDYYKGSLTRGRPHGESGYHITSAGHTYIGPWVSGQKCGADGKMIYQNGDIYIGGWFNDERHGQGEYVEKRTGNRYVGGFENGKRWGPGTTYWQVADQQADMCQICYEEEIDALFYDCGHVCACVTCAKQCDTCPICRRSVRQVVKMYRA